MANFPMIIVNETLPLVLKLNPNPNAIDISREKVFSQQQTVGGWVFEHWGEAPRTLRVRGRTQPVLGDGAPGQNTTAGVEIALFALQQVYSLDKRAMSTIFSQLRNAVTQGKLTGGKLLSSDFVALSQTFIYYKFDLYNGFFTKFSYQQEGQSNPRHYEYEFEFLVTSTAQSQLTDTIFMSSLGSNLASLASLVSLGKSGNMVQGASLLAGGAITSKLAGITGLR